MREGKFLEVSKKPSNFFLEKDRDVPIDIFGEAVQNYEGDIAIGSERADEWYAERAVELSPDREKVVQETLQAALAVIKKYAGKEVSIDRAQIIFLPVGTVKENDPNFQDRGGSASLELQRVQVEVGENDSNSEIADKVFHELMHLGSFYRMRYGTENERPEMGNYHTERTGLKILDPDGSAKFFSGLDEALTQVLSLRHLKSQRENPLYKEDFEQGKETFGNELEGGVLTHSQDDQGEIVPVMSHSYYPEIEAATGYIEGLYRENTDRFKSVEEVWEIFFQAKFTGRLLSLARLIEKTHGKGRFRTLGEVSNESIE